MKRAAFACRWLAIVWSVEVLTSFALATARDQAVVAIRGGGHGTWETLDESWETLRVVGDIGQVTTGALSALAVIGVVLLAAALHHRKARTLAWVAVAAGALQLLGLAIGWYLQRLAYDPSQQSLHLALWLARNVALFAMLVLALAACAAQLGGRLYATALAVAVLGVAFVAMVAVTAFATEPMPALRWFVRMTFAVSGIVFVSSALWSGALAARAPEPARARVHRAALTGAPLRLLVRGLLVRIGIGITSGVVVAFAIRSGGGSALVLLAVLGSLIGTAIILTATVRYLKLPSSARNGAAIAVAIVLGALGALAELATIPPTLELTSLIEQARSASSFWSTPSLSDMEELQATIAWIGRVAQVLGVAGALALVVSLRETAGFLRDADAERRSNLLLLLLPVSGTTALGLTFANEAELHEALGMLMILAVAALALAIATLATWIGLLKRVAAGLDRARREGDSAAAEEEP